MSPLKQTRLRSNAARMRARLKRQQYSTPWFVLTETLGAFRRHNGLSLSASLSFYAMFALIPMTLLLFFLLSHLIFSSDYAIVQLAIITSNLVPDISQHIMKEVYNISQRKAVWGLFGTIALLWAVVPLAGALRTTFHTISSMTSPLSFFRRVSRDTLIVVGILLLLIIFTFGGLMLGKLLEFLRPQFVSAKAVNNLSSIFMSTLLLTAFYRAFFPIKVLLRHVLVGALLTSLLWLAMRPAFGLMLAINPQYGAVFGGMKSIFISISWLYYNFAAFLLGTELIAILRKKDVLLLKDLFSGNTLEEAQLEKLKSHFGKEFVQGDTVFHQGDPGEHLYYIVTGNVTLTQGTTILHQLSAGEYFGEMAFIAKSDRLADASISSEHAFLLEVSVDHIETLLIEEPTLARHFLNETAARLRHTSSMVASQK